MKTYFYFFMIFIYGCASINYQSPEEKYRQDQKMRNQQRDDQLKSVLELSTKDKKLYLLGGSSRGNNPCFEIDNEKSSRAIPLKLASVDVWTPDQSTERKVTFNAVDDKNKEYKIYATLNMYLDDYQALLDKCFIETKKIKSKISSAERKAILKNKIYVNANKDIVLLALGSPNSINTNVNQYAKHEQWVYGYEYIYFRNGVVTSWQQ